MSQSPSSSQQMMEYLNEIDPVAFYTSSCPPSLTEVSTILVVNISEPCPPTLEFPIDLNDPPPSSQPGHPLSVLSVCLFEGDLPENRYSESNILTASENLVVESLTEMREGVRNEEGSRFAENLLDDTELVFETTPEVRVPPSNDSEDDEDDNSPLRWAIQKRMVHITNKGKEKVVEETPIKKPFTRGATKKLMSDVMNTSKANTTEIRRRRETGEEIIVIPVKGVVDVSNEKSESDTVYEDIIPAVEKKIKKGHGKKKRKPKSRKSLVKKVDVTTKVMEKEPEKKRGKERSKRGRETSPDTEIPTENPEMKSERGPESKIKKVQKNETKTDIVDNLRMQ
ncbi:hypothetical protein KY284_032866 [Solanum tuberosum]|nr:hypothetical protein KY284_032866 [Solanum tuberosum]